MLSSNKKSVSKFSLTAGSEFEVGFWILIAYLRATAVMATETAKRIIAMRKASNVFILVQEIKDGSTVKYFTEVSHKALSSGTACLPS